MVQNLKIRWLVVIVTLIAGILWVLPNTVNLPESWPFSKKKLVLGLDIQGGIHLVLGVDTESVLKEKTVRTVKNLEGEFKDRNIPYKFVRIVDADNSEMAIEYATPQDREQIEKYINDYYGTVLQILGDSDNTLQIRYYDAYVLETKKQILNQAIEVIRNRIDEFGVAEPSIAAQGTDRILVQLPGIKDAERAKELINRTAKLEFRAISYEVPTDKLQQMITEAEQKGQYKIDSEGMTYQKYIKRLNEDLEKQLPANTRVIFEKAEAADTMEAGRRPYLVKLDSHLSGDNLDDASVGTDEYGKPQVNFRFNLEGRKLFAELTGANVGGQVAIVLDDVIKSAPSIEEKIDSDSARIRLGSRDYNSAWQEAQFIATALRAGALPAALEQLEERTVGPSLGADSIAKGEKGALIGAAIVLLFMILKYGILGVVASIAIILNMLFTFAVLSSLGATLTLPGVAGMALTVGMAVDANIIIFERMKEELAKGASQLGALRDGFGNAFSSIFDSNITTILTCVILMYFGTGPIRGFAVTLAIGIIASMYTAVFVSRLMADTLAGKMKINLMKVTKG